MSVALVRQGDAYGCVIASLAMVTGQTYAAVKADLHPYLYLPHGAGIGGLPPTVAEGYLVERGYALAKRYRHHEAAVCDRDVWPPRPFADMHLCEVATSGTHCVVMLADGAVLDPWSGIVPSLSHYSRVFSVTAVWRVRDPLPDAILNHASAGRALPSVCQCRVTWDDAPAPAA